MTEARRTRRGLSRPMLAILIATGVLTAVSIVSFRCNDRGKAGQARFNFNEPKAAGRTATLDDLIEKATTRAQHKIPGARLVRLSVKRIDAAGGVHLRSGNAVFELVGPAGATPCGVQLAVGTQGWTERKPGNCALPPLEPRCAIGEVIARAFPSAPDGLEVSAIAEGAPARWTLKRLDVEGAGPVEVADDCVTPAGAPPR
jgi:hypothetical protein